MISGKVAALTEGVLRTMLLTKLKSVVAVILALAMVVGLGAGLFGYRTAVGGESERKNGDAATASASPPSIELSHQAAKPGGLTNVAPGPTRPRTTNEVYKRLSSAVSVTFPPNTTLDDAVDLLQAKTGIPIVIEETTFPRKKQKGKKRQETVGIQPVILFPKLTDVRPAAVLRLILEPVQATDCVATTPFISCPAPLSMTAGCCNSPYMRSSATRR